MYAIVALLALCVGAFAAPAYAALDALPDIPDATTVWVPGAGVTQGAYLFRPGDVSRRVPGVLLLHGTGGNAEDLVYEARVLMEQGYVALAITMRGFRGSDGEDDCGAQQADDAVAALTWLGQQPGVDSSRLGIIGFGQGGQVALLAAARSKLPRAVVGYFPITDTVRLKTTTAYKPVRTYLTQLCDRHDLQSVSPIVNAASINAPVLLIHGGADDRVPVSQSQFMQAALQAAGKQAELHVLPAARHDFTPEEYQKSWPWVIRFLGTHQMLSVASRSAEQQKRVNVFTEQGWSFRLGKRGIQTIRVLGPIKRERVSLLENPHVAGRSDEVREFFFSDGLYVKALFPGRQQNAYLLQNVEVTKPKYKLKYGLNIGATRELVEEKLGTPDGEQEGYIEYFHSMGIGNTRIYFENNRIVKVEWEIRAD